MSAAFGPCPFCGSTDVAWHCEKEETARYTHHVGYVACQDWECGATIRASDGCEEGVRMILEEKWNRRAPQTATSAERDGAKRL